MKGNYVVECVINFTVFQIPEYCFTIVNSHERLQIIIFFVNQTAMEAEKESEKWHQQIQELQDKSQGMSAVAPNLNDHDSK